MHKLKDNVFSLSVRELVEFIYRSGDLSSRKGGKREQSMLAGTRIHQKIQRRQGPEYRPEVPYSITIPVYLEEKEAPAYFIYIDGRADGVFTEDGKPAIDEIKGMYRDVFLITEPEQVHVAQAICYAYMDGVEDHLDRIIRMTYVNLDSEEEKIFTIPMTWEEIERWFTETVEKYSRWCSFTWKHRKARNESIRGLEFPYEYRPGQRNLVVTAYRFLQEHKNLYLQASTGIGKTLSTMYPAIRNIEEGSAERIFYLTAKTITASVAREAMQILQDNGLKASWVNLTAKEKLCMLDEMSCNPDDCPYAKGYFDRVNEAVFDLINEKSAITREDILSYAEKYKVCPFEMSLDVTYWVDTIICDYNYAFDPTVRLQRFFGDGSCDAILLIDEAHNLVDRAREMISATLFKSDFLSAKKIIEPYSKRLKNAIERCNKELLSFKRECDEFTVYENPEIFSGLFMKLGALMEEFSRFYENNPRFYDKDISLFYFQCRSFWALEEAIQKGYVFYGKLTENQDYSVTLANVDPSEYLKGCLDQVNGSVLFSATLLPINYYKSLLTGEQGQNAIYAESPFDTSKRLLVIGQDVTSKYSKRGKDEYKKIARYIERISAGKAGHYIAFFPSYAFMQQVYDQMPDQSIILMQGQNMNEAAREEFLKSFEEKHDETIIGFCVMGGIFSEGIDLKGTALIGVIIVGTGLPGISPERNLIKNYFDDISQDGFAYAYLYPGIGRVLQAAGRLIRTDTDEGVVALLDDRFAKAEYRRLFPREWNDARFVKLDTVSSVIEDFWKNRS